MTDKYRQVAENWYFLTDLSCMKVQHDYSIDINTENFHSDGFTYDVTCLVLNKIDIDGEDVIQKVLVFY